jgi:hypothetical protein
MTVEVRKILGYHLLFGFSNGFKRVSVKELCNYACLTPFKKVVWDDAFVL